MIKEVEKKKIDRKIVERVLYKNEIARDDYDVLFKECLIMIGIDMDMRLGDFLDKKIRSSNIERMSRDVQQYDKNLRGKEWYKRQKRAEVIQQSLY